MAGRKSFIMYLDLKPTLEKLPMEERGRLITAIYDFVESGEITELDNPATDIAFSILCQTIRRDNEKYEEICEKNAERSRNYWGKRNQKMSEDIPAISTDIHNDNDKVNDSDIDSENDNETVNVTDNDNKNTNKNPPSQARSSVTRAAKVGKDENEKESAAGARDNGDDPDPIIKYGSYNNVPMARSEYEALMAEYGKEALRYLDDLSQNIALAGKTFDDPSGYIRDWMKRNGIKPLSERAPKDKPMPKGYELLKQRARFV